MVTTLTIERLGHRGDGVATGPVYVPRTLPGELVSGEVDGTTLRDVRIVSPSAHRVAAPCPHYRACGGCQLQHAEDDFVTDWRVTQVCQALGAQGIEAEVAGVAISPPRSRRRAVLAVRRTKKAALAGFHARASDTITPISDCMVLSPELLQALPAAEALGVTGASRKGELDVTMTASEGGIDVAVTGGKPLDTPLRVALAGVAEAHDLARLSWDGETVAGRRPALQRFGRAMVEPPPGAFLQATREGEAALLAAVREIVGEAARIVDLFAGSGTFALPLAEHAEIHAVEGEAAMCAALDRGWRGADRLKRVTTEARDLFRRPLLPDELKGFDAAVIDPPRSGAEAQVAALAEARIPVIAHVSCNPITFAREAATLVRAGYRMGPLRIVDQFRWSAHTEVVAGFTLGA